MFNSYLQLPEGMAKSGNPSGFHRKIFENMRNTWVFERAMTSFTAHTHTHHVHGQRLEPEICQVVLTCDALRMAPQPKQMPGGDTPLNKNSCCITDLTRTIRLWIEDIHQHEYWVLRHIMWSSDQSAICRSLPYTGHFGNTGVYYT